MYRNVTDRSGWGRAAVLIAIGLVGGCGSPVAPTPATTGTPVGSNVVSAGLTAPPASGSAAAPTSGPSAAASLPVLPSGPPVDPADLTGKIAFAYDGGVWVADGDGTHRRRLTSDDGFDPTLSPDGRTIVYRLLLAADDGEIWTMRSDGGGRRDLVNDPDFSDWGPAFSPDGGRIAYSSNRIDGLAIWLMDADGTHQHLVTRGHGEYPAWSPDGKRIAYAGGSYYDIWVVDADGSNQRAITETVAYDMGPAWSPDGAWIAYHTQSDWYPDLEEPGMGAEMEIHLVRPDGSDDHRITADRVEDSFAAWSPDGRHLMWVRHGELVVARADGSGRIELGPGNFPSWVP